MLLNPTLMYHNIIWILQIENSVFAKSNESKIVFGRENFKALNVFHTGNLNLTTTVPFYLFIERYYNPVIPAKLPPNSCNPSIPSTQCPQTYLIF